MINKLIVSSSPHMHGTDSVKKNMYGVLIALLPALLISFYFFGSGAVLTTAVSVLACMFFEWAINTFLLKSKKITLTDGSAVITGVLLAFNVPSTLPIWMIIVGALVAIGVGKMTFGGLGNNLFNPALVGRVFLLISFPVAMTTWPAATNTLLADNQTATEQVDATSAATPLALMKRIVKYQGTITKETQQLAANKDSLKQANLSATSQKKIEKLVRESEATIQTSQAKLITTKAQLPTNLEMLVGQTKGSLGEVSALALLLGLAYMLWKKIITWHIPVSIIGTVFIFAALMHLINPLLFVAPQFHLFSGGLMLGAIFMATDYVSSPMSHKGMLVYGVSIGFLTVVIRLFGAYPEGLSFAILIMNGFTPLINNYFKPRRFGRVVKK